MPRDRTLAVRTTSKPPSLEGEGRFLVGYAAVFDSDSQVLYDDDVTDDDGNPTPFIERIDPHAFDRAIKSGQNIKALFNHDTSKPLGSTNSGTLKLSADSTGLAFKVTIPDVSYGNDARVLVRDRIVEGCSFRFYTIRDDVQLRDGMPALRTLHEVDIDEITPVCTYPAYLGSMVQVRAKGRGEGPSERTRDHLARVRRKLRLIDLGMYRDVR